MSRTFAFFFFLMACCFSTSAQQYSFKNYTVADGLGGSGINHIFQDSRGYIWFATQEGGVSRFNGKEFQNFTKTDGLINNDVTYITEDREGVMWIGTASGASSFDENTFKNYGLETGLTNGIVFSIRADPQNKIWFATKDRGVRINNGSTFDSLTTDDGLPSNEVYTLTQDKQGNHWFGLAYGIAKYQDEKVTSYKDSIHIEDNAFFSSMLDAQGNVWFGSTNGTIVEINDANSIQRVQLPALMENDFIGGMTQDKLGNLWFATDHGLLKYDGGEFKIFSEEEGLSANIAQTVMCDYEGNIWCGTLGGGANLLTGEAFLQYTEKHGLFSRHITCIEKVPNNNTYYVGTGNGLFGFNPANDPPFTQIKSEEVDLANIASISIDNQGLIWICTLDGIVVIGKRNDNYYVKKVYKEINGERVISPTKIIHDSKGNCWVATYGSGLFFLSGQNERVFNTKTGFPSDNLLTVYEDAQSNIWVGSYDAGILKHDENSFSPIHMNDTENDAVWCISGDNDGNIYFGTGESGVYKYDGTNTVRYSTLDGLNSGYYNAIQWDRSTNSLWLGSEKGLESIVLNNKGQIAQHVYYSEQNGFKRVAFNHNSILVDTDSLVWLGTANGLWQYNEQETFSKSVSPKIQLTGIRIFYQQTDLRQYSDFIDQQTKLPRNLQLPHNKNHLTFDIQALTTKEVKYKFILEGLDKDWSFATKNNEITYSNISPGDHYTFKAKAINADGIESKDVVSLSFSILPPWWATWWFRSIIFLMAISMLIAFVKGRERMLKERNLRLEATVQQRTSEIARQKEVIENTLSEKEGLLKEKEVLLKEIHHRVKNNLQTISSMLMLQSAGLTDAQAKKAIAESQNRVSSVALVHQKLYQTEGLEKIELNGFIKDLTKQIKSVYPEQSKHVSIHWKIPKTYLLIDTAIPLGLIINELLTNSFKYAFQDAKQGDITIELSSPNTKQASRTKDLKLTYHDSGPGLGSPEKIDNPSTLGLRLVKLLSEQIGGNLQYSNTNGCTFILTFERFENLA